MRGPKVIESSEWQFNDLMVDYRFEWPGDMLVERATWHANAPEQQVVIQGAEPVTIALAGYIWFRFWLADEEQLVERYFDNDGQPVGTYVPICMPLERQGRNYITTELLLGLWIAADGRVTVRHEEEFDQAVSSGTITPVESERAEIRIRELTGAIAQKQFPPALVRNFSIKLGEE